MRAVRHLGRALGDRDGAERAEQARHVRRLARLRGVVAVNERRFDEAGGAAVIAGYALHAQPRAERRQLHRAPGRGIGILVGEGEVVAQVGALPAEIGLVGEDVGVVLPDAHALLHAFDHDAAGGIADEPMEVRDGEMLVDGLCHHGHRCERGADLVEAGEGAGDPERELVGGHVDGSLPRLGRVARAVGEVEARDGEPGVVAAVEIQGDAGDDDAHADDRVPDGGFVVALERGWDCGGGGSGDDALTVALRPIEVPAEVHRALGVREADSRAHAISFRPDIRPGICRSCLHRIRRAVGANSKPMVAVAIVKRRL